VVQPRQAREAVPVNSGEEGLFIDFGHNHPFAAGRLAIGADDSIHLERMVYQRKLSDASRKGRQP
jgi:hypothetical protein